MLASSSVQGASNNLADGIAVLDRALKGEVTAHYDDLLAQLGGIGEADRVLEIVRGGVHSLQETMGRVRDEIVEPHRMVSSKTRQLENLTQTVDTLHRIIRMLKLIARLKESLGAGASARKDKESAGGLGGAGGAASSTSDLAKAAKMLTEIRELEREGGAHDLAGVDVIDRDARWLAAAGRDIRAQAAAALRAGMEASSQAEVGAALQVYHNLGELNVAVDSQVSALAAAAVDHVREALDPQRLSAAMGGGPGGGGGGGESPLARLGKLALEKLEDDAALETLCSTLRGTTPQAITSLAGMAGVPLGEASAAKLHGLVADVQPKQIKRLGRWAKRAVKAYKLLGKGRRFMKKRGAVLSYALVAVFVRAAAVPAPALVGWKP